MRSSKVDKEALQRALALDPARDRSRPPISRRSNPRRWFAFGASERGITVLAEPTAAPVRVRTAILQCRTSQYTVP
jgi:hypothetical protein